MTHPASFGSACFLGWLCLCLACGCSKGRGPTLAPAGGTVTYQGKPLAGATVTFVPNDGPLAQAVTDLNGHFTLATGTIPGVAVGSVRVTVSASPPEQSKSEEIDKLSKVPKTGEESTAFLEAAGDMQQSMAEGKDTPVKRSRSLIPEKYVNATTSDLKFTVEAGKENNFKIDLVD